MSTSRFWMISAIAFGLLAASCAAAGEPELGVRIDRQSVLLGDTVRLTVTVKNDPSPEKPQVGEVPGFDLKYRGVRQESFSSVTVVVQGKTVEQRHSGGGFFYDFDLIPKAAGSFDIPPIPVSYKDRLFSTDRFKIEVLAEAQKSEDIFVELTADKSRIYLGESVTVSFKWFFNKNVNQYEIRLPWLDAPEGFVVTDPPQDPGRKYQKLLVNGSQEVLAVKGMEIHKGREYAVVSFDKVLTPHRAGDLDLDAAFVKGNVVTGYEGSGRSSFFDDFFGSDSNAFFAPMGGRAVTEPFAARSENLRLTVREVPREGAPADFAGAVGRFAWKVTASPSRLKTGEPVSLKIELSGEGNIEEAVIPVPGDMDGFKGYEPESKFMPAAEHPGSGIRSVEKVWVARKPGVFEIPGVRWSYYDSAAGQFKTLTAGPFPVRVEPSVDSEASPSLPAKTSRPDSPASALFSGPAAAEPPQALSRDIRYLKGAPGRIRSRGTEEQHGGIPFVFFALIPLAVIGAAAGLAEWRLSGKGITASRVSAARRSAGSLCVEARAGLAARDARRFYAAAEKAVAKYLSDRWGLPAGMSAAELLDRIPEGRISADERRFLDEFVKRTERTLFGSAPADFGTLQKDGDSILGIFKKWGIEG